MPRLIRLPCPETPVFEDDHAKGKDDHFPNKISRTWEIDVVTPLFGGGPDAGVNDPIQAVRVPSIRGHLRFWWRATRGLDYTAASRLRGREREIWGAAALPDSDIGPSQVIVEVSKIGPGRPVTAEELRKKSPDIGYAVFPFQENKKENRPARAGLEGVRFSLTLRYHPRLGADVVPAVWAWINFGGVGARTRRGLGALHSGPPFVQPVDREGRWFAQRMQRLKLAESSLRPWPVLSEPPVVSAPLPTAEQAWIRSLRQMREFRQGYGTGRRGDSREPGRSYWPEADSLRMMTGQGQNDHMDSLTVDDYGFPRTALGMPIVMHFKGREDGANDCELAPAEVDIGTKRMASPIIVRPLAVSVGKDVKYVAMALRLLTRGPSGVSIEKHKFSGGPTDIVRAEFADYPNSPMKGTKGSAVDAFMAFARKNL